MRKPWLALGVLLGAALPAIAPAAAPKSAPWQIPTAIQKLPNGLTVVVSEDHSTPTFGLCLAYRVGFRLEPKGRTGFAHLFEHMMFEGTPTAPKGILQRVVEGGGGVNNGSTRFDYTNYVETAPVSALDAILWLEADRMQTLDFSEKNLANQRDVVKEEIRVNVKNRPYGIFYWTDLCGKAFDKWENTHDGYGSFEDLDKAAVQDVESFFKSYYGPNNAVIAIVGDVTPADVFAKAAKYFGPVASRPTPAPSDFSEGLNSGERTLQQTDALAKVPAVAVGWKAAARGSEDHVPMAVLSDLLAGGEASRLYLNLVKGKELLLNLNGGVNWPLGTPWTYDGPTLLTLFGLYKPTTDAKTVVNAIQAEVDAIAQNGVPADELTRTKTKMVSDLYSNLELPLNRANALCLTQMFTGNAGWINELPGKIEAVTSADLQRAAGKYLTVANRTVIDRQPAAPSAPATTAATEPGK